VPYIVVFCKVLHTHSLYAKCTIHYICILQGVFFIVKQIDIYLIAGPLGARNLDFYHPQTLGDSPAKGQV